MAPEAAGYSGKPRIDKLGIEPHARVSVVGVDDTGFMAELRARTADVSEGPARKGSHAIVFGADSRKQLVRLATLRRALDPAGMLWVVWPKGRPELREDDIRAAAIAAGLVDVKVIAFSQTLSGLKLVIPLALRKSAAGDARRRTRT
jgi:hypothetical protein